MVGWKFIRIGDVCKTGAGGTPLKSRKEYYYGGMIPWLLSGEVAQGEIHKSEKFITPAGLDNSSAKIFPVNTVLVAMYGATAGQVGILRCEAATNQAVCGILPSSYFVPEFMFYAMLSKQAELIATATGNAQPNISQIKVKNTIIPLPPLPEQKSIVAILDDAFAGIDAAVVNTEKNLANARELFESYLNAVFTRKGDGWVEKKLEDMTAADSPITYGVVKPGDEGDVPFIRGGDLVRGQVRVEKLRTISKSVSKQYKRTLLQGGELLICLVGQPGQTGVVTDSLAGANIARQVGLIRLQEKHDAYFVNYYLRSPLGQEALGAYEGGSVQQVINLRDLKQVKVPLPTIEEQKTIVSGLDLGSAKLKRLEAIYKQKLTALAELKQSILQKAFAGELTALPEKTIEEAVA